MNLYVVTADGWTSGWGTEIYLVGVYDSEEQALKVIEENESLYCKMSVVELNKTYKMKKDDSWGNYTNKLYLGGYYE